MFCSNWISILTVLNLIYQIQTDPYYCTVKESRILIKNLKSYRFIVNDYFVYLIFKTKIILFEIPKILKSESSDEYYYSSKQPAFIENNYNETKGEAFKVDLQLIDHKVTAQEYVFNKDSNESRVIVNDLKFDPNAPGKQMMKTFYKMLSKPDYYEFDYQLDSLHVVFKYHSSLLTVNVSSSSELEKQFKLTHNVEKAVFYASDKNTASNVLIELDDKRNLHLNKVEIDWTAKTIDVLRRVTVPLVEFFSCYQPLTNFKQLKGIVYNESADTYYIFINHFYLILNGNLTEERFDINQTHYNAKEFRFKEIELKEVTFENSPNKLIKFDVDKVYVTMLNGLFELSTEDDEVILKAVPVSSSKQHYLDCKTQLLKIDDHVYCFGKNKYQLIAEYKFDRVMKKESKPFDIKELFSNTGVIYEGSQILELIYKYKNNQVVLMTQSNLFIVDYDSLTVNEANSKLSINHSKKADVSKIRKLPNCILPNELCKPNIDVIIHEEDPLQIILICLIAILALTIIILMCVYCRLKLKIVNTAVKRSQLLNRIRTFSRHFFVLKMPKTVEVTRQEWRNNKHAQQTKSRASSVAQSIKTISSSSDIQLSNMNSKFKLNPKSHVSKPELKGRISLPKNSK